MVEITRVPFELVRAFVTYTYFKWEALKFDAGLANIVVVSLSFFGKANKWPQTFIIHSSRGLSSIVCLLSLGLTITGENS